MTSTYNGGYSGSGLKKPQKPDAIPHYNSNFYKKKDSDDPAIYMAERSPYEIEGADEDVTYVLCATNCSTGTPEILFSNEVEEIKGDVEVCGIVKLQLLQKLYPSLPIIFEPAEDMDSCYFQIRDAHVEKVVYIKDGDEYYLYNEDMFNGVDLFDLSWLVELYIDVFGQDQLEQFHAYCDASGLDIVSELSSLFKNPEKMPYKDVIVVEMEPLSQDFMAADIHRGR